MLKHFWSIRSCNYQNKVKQAISQVSVNYSSSHLIELYATELISITCGELTFACSFISCVLVEIRDSTGVCHMTQY